MRDARELHFTGQVQGIGFRWTAKQLADRLGVAGWVKNNPDGSVTVVAEEAEGDIDSLVERLDQSLGRYITGVKSSAAKPTGRDGFRIRR